MHLEHAEYFYFRLFILRNGFIEQWGKITGSTDVEKDIPFYVTYVNKPSILGSPHMPDNGTVPYVSMIYKVTTTVFKGYFQPRESNVSGNGYAYTWIAMGY